MITRDPTSRRALANGVVAALVLAAAAALWGCADSGGKSEAPVTTTTSQSGCQPTLPTSQESMQVRALPSLKQALLVDPNPASWGVALPEGVPLSLDGSIELAPLHVGVRHRFDPRLNVNEEVDAQVYLIFPRNDFTVKAPAGGWRQEPGSAANVVYCSDLHGLPNLTPGAAKDVFWITPLVARPFSVQWQVVGTAKSGPLSSGLRGFTLPVTP